MVSNLKSLNSCLCLGHSFLGQPILAWKIGSKELSPILVIGAVHGDEVESTALINDYLARFLTGTSPQSILRETFLFVPVLNPDGTLLSQRWNFRNVDLNRNLPTSNWKAEASNLRYPPGDAPASEPETQVFLNIIEQFRPKVIVSVHSFSESLVIFPTSEVAGRFADPVRAFAESLGISVVEKMNYAVYGSLSVYGKEQGIATITVELQRGLPHDELIKKYSAPFSDLLHQLEAIVRAADSD